MVLNFQLIIESQYVDKNTVFNINNKDLFIEHKIVKDHVTLKIIGSWKALSPQE